MKSDSLVKYLSIAGSICSIWGWFIAMSVKLDWIKGISFVLSLIGGISLFAFFLWLIDQGYKELLKTSWWPSVFSLKVFVYFCLGLLGVVFAFSFGYLVFSFVEVAINGAIQSIFE